MNGPQKAKISNAKFNQWLKKRKFEVLGKEFKHRVQSGGWPDFIVKNSKGKIEFFEVKSGKHQLDSHQKEILKILQKIGRVRIMRLDERMKKFIDETYKSL